MSIKEYNKSGNCEIHKDCKLDFVPYDPCYDDGNYYECSRCRKEDSDDLYKFLQETSKRVDLMPEWKGGRGLGVACPCCKGQGLLLPEDADKIKKKLKI